MLLFTVPPRFDMEVGLSVPTEEEECPMTKDTMKNYELDFAEGVCVDVYDPSIRKMTLPCGHAFSAMASLYYFCRKGLQCPLCRSGVNEKLDGQCLPVHMRDIIMQQVNKKDSEERVEEEMQNYRDTLAMIVSDIEYDFDSFINENKIVLVVYCYDDMQELVPIVAFDFELKAIMHDNIVQFYMQRGDLRLLTRSLHNVAPLNIVQFAVGIKGQQFIFLDRSIKIDLTNMAMHNIIYGRGDAQFLLESVHADGDADDLFSIVDFKWTITMATFQQWVGNQSLFLFGSI